MRQYLEKLYKVIYRGGDPIYVERKGEEPAIGKIIDVPTRDIATFRKQTTSFRITEVSDEYKIGNKMIINLHGTFLRNE